MRYLKTPGMLLYQERFDLRGRVRGLLPSGIFAFAVPIRLGSRSAYWGAPVQRAGLPAMRGGGLDAVLDSGQDQLLVLAKASLIRSHFPARVAEALERCADTRLLPAEEQDIALFGDWLFGLIHNGLNQPEVLQYAAAANAIEEDLLQRLGDVVRVPLPDGKRLTMSKRRAAISRALEYIRCAERPNPTIQEVNQAAGFSQRTLEYAFRETFGLTAIAFLQLRLFHAVRRALIAADPRKTTVAYVACSLGFYQLGRFAASYKRTFGEFPSQTPEKGSPPARRRISPLVG